METNHLGGDQSHTGRLFSTVLGGHAGRLVTQLRTSHAHYPDKTSCPDETSHTGRLVAQIRYVKIARNQVSGGQS